MRVLLISTYELGHQPLHIASPAAALIEAGHDVRTLDISVEEWNPALVDWADGVAFSVPMHTAMRLAVKGAEAVKGQRADLPVCFYGLYAGVRSGSGADFVVSGEYEKLLVAWAGGVPQVSSGAADLGRTRFRLPVRTGLPPLRRYAHLAIDGEERPVGYVEASHGCAHRCRHCPVPVVYDGRTRRVDAEIVLDDVAQLVAQGARHITFGDPDFLNRWTHSMQITDEIHRRFPDLTYDITTKVSHIVRHADLLDDLARTGCLFAVSAFECVNDDILAYLDKGHNAAQAAEAIGLLRSRGIEPRPSWLPFTPWTTVEDVEDILDFVIALDLIGNVDPVQYSIRLLIPQGSLMLDVPELGPYLGPYDAESLSYTWRAADERTVPLQRRIVAIVEEGQRAEKTVTELFCDVRDAVLDAAGHADGADRELILAGSTEGRPGLTEPWFC